MHLQSQADVLFLKHDTKLADEKITVLLDKLQRLEVRLTRVREQGQQEPERKLEEEETTEESLAERGDKKKRWDRKPQVYK